LPVKINSRLSWCNPTRVLTRFALIITIKKNTSKGITLFPFKKDELAAVKKHFCWRSSLPHHQIIDKESTLHHVFYVIIGKVRIVNCSYFGHGVVME
jgi:hypothetical protein